MNWWWGLWLVASLSALGLTYSGTTDAVIARAYTNAPSLLVIDAVVVAAAVAGVFVVRAVTAVQQKHLRWTPRRGAAELTAARGPASADAECPGACADSTWSAPSAS